MRNFCNIYNQILINNKKNIIYFKNTKLYYNYINKLSSVIMFTFKRIILLLTCLLMVGCIGPFYNPYPLSKLVAKVGPPLKLNNMSDQEKVNEETKTENSDEVNTNKENNSAESTDAVQENSNNLNIKVVDEKTITAQWQLNLKENLILPPDEIKNAVTKKCLNGNSAKLITFSSSEGMAKAIFKCW